MKEPDGDATGSRPVRVRVTAPSTRSASDLSALVRAQSIREEELDRDRCRRLVRQRLRLALVCAGSFAAAILAAATATSFFAAAVDPLPIHWLVLCAVAFAAMLGSASWFIHASNALDERFSRQRDGDGP